MVVAAVGCAASSAPWWAWGSQPYPMEVPSDMAERSVPIWVPSPLASAGSPAEFVLARAEVCACVGHLVTVCVCLCVCVCDALP